MRTTFVDTSVLLEVLRVPGKSQQPDAVRTELRERVGTGESLLLPTAAIVETGNHIAQIADGNLRRKYAESFVTILRSSTRGSRTWPAAWAPGRTMSLCRRARRTHCWADPWCCAATRCPTRACRHPSSASTCWTVAPPSSSL